MGKTYWYNEGTDTLLTEKEYKAKIESEAKEWLEDLQEDEEELEEGDKTSLETLIHSYSYRMKTKVILFHLIAKVIN